MRRAKIVCTIGPASAAEDTIGSMVEAGMDVARINFSHGSHDGHREVCERIRSISGRVAVMQDLQGPKIRVGRVPGGSLDLARDDEFVIVTGEAVDDGAVGVDYDRLHEEVSPGDDIFMADGVIHLEVLRVSGRKVVCRVIHGGTLTSRKGVNLPGVSISAPALTAKDREDLDFGLSLGVDLVALSFVRDAGEILELRELIERRGSQAGIVAKIEKREALRNIDEIIEQADAVMIARGDLGVEIPTEDVPLVQKRLISRLISAGKPVITATQMLESMVNSELPTRAEASDVANATLDGSDALMLSAETATGMYPVGAVRMMGRIIQRAESQTAPVDRSILEEEGRLGEIDSLTDAVCAGAVETASNVGASAIAVLTHSGRTARFIARRRPAVPILALTDQDPVLRKLSLLWGVRALPVESIETTERIFALIREKVQQAGYSGRIVLTAGIPTKDREPTNTIHVIDVQ